MFTIGRLPSASCESLLQCTSKALCVICLPLDAYQVFRANHYPSTHSKCFVSYVCHYTPPKCFVRSFTMMRPHLLSANFYLGTPFKCCERTLILVCLPSVSYNMVQVQRGALPICFVCTFAIVRRVSAPCVCLSRCTSSTVHLPWCPWQVPHTYVTAVRLASATCTRSTWCAWQLLNMYVYNGSLGKCLTGTPGKCLVCAWQVPHT